MTETKIFLIEPLVLTRVAFASLVQAQEGFTIVGQAGDGSSETIADIEQTYPDLILLAAEIVSPTAAQFIKLIKSRFPHMRFLAIVQEQDDLLLQRLIRSGCNGFLLRSSTAEELFNGIRAIAGGANFVGNNMLDRLLNLAISGLSSISETRLSSREQQIVQKVASGYSSLQIATQMRLSNKTVDTYRARAMAKLNLSSRAELVRYAIANGWLDQSESCSS